jgi:hypothetical protein
MNFFSEIEKGIERGFRRFTERMFGPADASELLLVHRAILEEIGGQIQTVARGERIFPFARVTVTLISSDAGRRALYQAAFGDEGRLEKDVRETLEGSRCKLPRGFALEVTTAETGSGPFEIQYGTERKKTEAAAPETTGRLIVLKGRTGQPEYTLERARTNLGRLAELTDAEQRVMRRNDVVFEEGDETNATVSRKHAHIKREAGEYRIVDDESEFGTRVFREGRSIEVPKGNRRGEKLRPGDEIYLGRACLRFER